VATETLVCDAVGTTDNWTLAAGSTKVAAVATDDGDTSRIESGTTSDTIQQFTLANPTAIASGDTINSVTLYAVCKRGGTPPGNYTVSAVLGGNTSDGTSRTSGASYAATSETFTTKPGGGAWTLTDVNNLVLQIRNTQTRNILATQLYAVVDYTVASVSAEGGSAAIVRTTSAGAGTKAASGGSAARVETTATSPSITYIYTAIVVLEDQALAVGGGSAATVLTTAVGSGTKHASGGAGATVETTASGSAPSYIYTAIVVLEGEELAASASGGSSTTVETTAAGAGTKAASGGSGSEVRTASAGVGSKNASGSSSATVETTAVGSGTKAVSGSASATVETGSAGSGTKQGSGSSTASVLITSTGAGTKAASGSSSATVETTAVGAGSKATSGGFDATVTTTAAGAGTKEKSGGSAASVETTAAGAGVKATSGGSGAIVETTAAGAGRHDYATLSSPRATNITAESFRPVVDIAYTEYMAGTIYFAVFYGFGFYEDELTWNRIDGWSITPIVEGSEAARDTDGTQTWATTVALGYDDEGYTIAFVWDGGNPTSEIVLGSFNIDYEEPPPEFDLAVWLAAFTDDAYTLAGEVQGPALAGTVYAVATLPSEGDPTEEQIIAGLNADGDPARGAGSLSGVTGAFELTIGGLKGELVHHLHAVFEYEEAE